MRHGPPNNVPSLIERFLGGPVTARPRLRMRFLLTLPLVCVAGFMTAASCAGAWQSLGAGQLPGLLPALLRDLEVAACIAFISLIAALPAANTGPRLHWLLPLWIGPQAASAGCALLPARHGPALAIAAGTTLLLPVMVLFLAASWRHLPTGLAETAAASGASPLQTLVLARLRPALPAALRGLGLVFVLAFGLAPLLAALRASP